MDGIYYGGDYFGGSEAPFGEAPLALAKPADRTAVAGEAIVPWGIVAPGATHYAAAGLPPGLAINSGTGVISGTPSAISEPSQAFPVTITVEGAGATVTTSFVYTIARLSILSPGPQENVVGQPVELDMVAPLATSFTATGLPTGLSIGAASGRITGTPTAAQDFPAVTVTAHAASGEVSVTFDWLIEAAGFALSPLASDMLDGLPPVLRESRDYRAVIQSYAKECERLGEALESVRQQFFPGQADVLLGVWERITRQAVNPPGRPLVERQAAVTARLRKMLDVGEGREWAQLVTGVIGPGWSYEEHIPGDPTSPPANVLRVTLPFGASDARYGQAVALFEEITPAHLVLNFTSSTAFRFDISQLDIDRLTV